MLAFGRIRCKTIRGFWGVTRSRMRSPSVSSIWPISRSKRCTEAGFASGSGEEASCWFCLYLLLGSSFVCCVRSSSLYHPRYPAILFHYSVVILRGPFSTHTLERRVRERRGQKARAEQIGHEARGREGE